MSLEPHSARLLPSVVQPPTIAFSAPGDPTPEALRGLGCPNCGSAAAKTLVLTVDVQLPDNPAKRLRVLRCPACTANFYDSQVPPDYAEPALNNRGRVPFYVEQGAGVSLITRPLAQIRRGAGTAYMEVGCGYGFGLDYAINTKGWTGVGIDPAPLAALGRDALQLPIELRYLRDDDEARGTFDVVMGSEVIEHVTSPSAFVRTLRAMLKPGGVLVLTTPNGADIDPGTPPGIIIPLLSPSLHLVIQNRQSLRALLEQGGFGHVEVDVDSHSLVAFASDAPLDLEEDRGALRGALRGHLERRAAALDPSTDLFVAFAGRALCESVNDGDMAAADRAWSLLVPGCRARFGIALDAMTALPAEVETCSLERMAELVPLNLGGMLYARAIRRIEGGAARAAMEAQFLLAARAARAMRRALGELAMEDGQTEDIEWTAEAEAVLCAADGGDAGLAQRLEALPPAPNGGEARRRLVALRAMTNLTNAGRYEKARDVVRALGLGGLVVAGGAPLGEVERDALFSLAVLDIRGVAGVPADDLAIARGRLRQVRSASEPGSRLWLAAVRGEAEAIGLLGRGDEAAAFAEAAWAEHRDEEVAHWAVAWLVNSGALEPGRALAERAGLDAGRVLALPGRLGEGQRDALFALAVLDSQAGTEGNAERAALGFARVRSEAEGGRALWLAALKGEVQALQLLGRTEEVAAAVMAGWREHGSAEVAAWVLVNLVNAGRYDDARGVARESGLVERGLALVQGGSRVGLPDRLTGDERDALFSLAVLDSQPGAEGDAERAAACFGRVRLDAAGGGALWWAALKGEVQALQLLGRTEALAAIVLAGWRAHGSEDVAGWVLGSLVNAGRHDDAREVARESGLVERARVLVHGAPHTAPDRLSDGERDALFSLAVLDSQPGAEGDAERAASCFRRVRRDAAGGGALWWAALKGEAQALQVLGRTGELAAAVMAGWREHGSQDVAGWVLVSLVNAGRYDEAREVGRDSGLVARARMLVREAPPEGGQLAEAGRLSEGERDALFSLAVLDLQPGAEGDAERAALCFGRVRRDAAGGGALWWGALKGEVQALQLLGRTEEVAGVVAAAWREHGAEDVAGWVLVTLVNAGRFYEARAVARGSGYVERVRRLARDVPVGAGRRAAAPVRMTDGERDALFSLAVLDSQPGAEGDAERAAVGFARVRREADGGGMLWWAALKGEVQALQLLGRTEDVAAVTLSGWRAHGSAEVAAWVLVSLVNAGRYDEARGVARESGLEAAPFTQPVLARPMGEADRDVVFCLAILDVQAGPDGGEPARARGRFSRVRKSCPMGSELWVAALRGELQALDMLDALDEAATMTAAIEAAHPELVLPPDILARIGKD